MKKIILLLLLLIGFSFSFANNIQKPQIGAVEFKDKSIIVHGTGFSKFDLLEGFYLSEKLDLVKVSNDNLVEYKNPDYIINGNFYLNGKKYNSDKSKFEEYKSNTIKLFETYDGNIQSIDKLYSEGNYIIIIKLNNRSSLQKIELFVNGKKIPEKDITDNGNEIKFNYSELNKSNYLNINIKIGDYLSETINYNLNNLYEFTFQYIEDKGNYYRLVFKSQESNDMKIYFNGKALDEKSYSFFGSSLLVDILKSNFVSVNSIEIETQTQRSNKFYISMDSYIYPQLNKFELSNGNKINYSNIIYGKNFAINQNNIGDIDFYEKISLTLNGKLFSVVNVSYDNWYNKIKNSYDSKIKEAIGNEKEKIISQMEKEVEKKNSIIFDFKLENDGKISFTQPIEYLTGKENSIKIKINGLESQIYKFNIDSNKAKQVINFIGENNLNTELYANFKFSSLTGLNDINKELNFGKLSILSGEGNSLFVNEIVFDLEIENNDSYIPIYYVKLGSFDGVIEKNNNNYKLIFKNIYLSKFKNGNYDLKIKFSDNINKIGLNIVPEKINYYTITGLESNNNRVIQINQENKGLFNYEILRSNCYDVSTKYENCNKIGYDNKTLYKFYLGVNENTIEIEEDNNIIDEEKTIKDEEKINTEKDIETKNNEFINNKSMQIFEVLNKYVSSKSKNDLNVEKKYFNQIYKLLVAFHSKLKEGNKKDIVKNVIIMIKNKYSK